MRTEHLTNNPLSKQAFDWYLAYLSALDKKDLEAYGTFLAEDVTMQMNNAAPMKGKKQVLAGLAQYWPSFGSLEHDLLTIHGSDHAFVLEALNHYHRLDGSPVMLRAVAFTDRNEAGLVTSARIYTDVAPLFASKA
jgi:ketosteroid isomerase-like protein